MNMLEPKYERIWLRRQSNSRPVGESRGMSGQLTDTNSLSLGTDSALAAILFFSACLYSSFQALALAALSSSTVRTNVEFLVRELKMKKLWTCFFS